MINRNLFARVAETKYKSVDYKKCDCQAFVETCAKEAGHTFNARGTNDMWRNYMQAKGSTSSFPLAVGDVVFKWREESEKLPARYQGDGNGDFYHIGILTGIEPYTVCHSANSKENGKKDSFSSLDALAKTWSHCGTLKNTEEEASSNEAIEAIDNIIADLEKLKKLV